MVNSNPATLLHQATFASGDHVELVVIDRRRETEVGDRARVPMTSERNHTLFYQHVNLWYQSARTSSKHVVRYIGTASDVPDILAIVCGLMCRTWWLRRPKMQATLMCEGRSRNERGSRGMGSDRSCRKLSLNRL